MTTLETLSYLSPEGALSKEAPQDLPDDLIIKAYQEMARTRHIDERMVTLQRQGVITFALRSLGEEGCSVGAAAALDQGDWIYPQYRESGVMFWRGFTTEEYVHHMFCNAKDLMQGRQMPNHFGSRKLNVVTVSSPIGTKIPHAAGCAYAMKIQGEPQVALSFFGEGAASEGDFHAGLNFASVRDAPVIFFCRNNGYAISTKTFRQYHGRGVAERGYGYGIESMRIDGNDFFAVYEAVSQARKRCLEGKGPVLIEAMTYRMGAHSTSDDPTRYRPQEEKEEWEKKDPMRRLRLYLEGKKLWDDEKETKLQEQLHEEVTKAIEQAKQAGNPPLRTLVEDVYFTVPDSLEKQYREVRTFFPEEADA